MDDAEQVAVVTTRRPVNQVSQALSEWHKWWKSLPASGQANEQDASTDPGVLASDSIGGDTTSSLEPTTSQETRAESSTTMRMAPTQVDMEVCKEDVEKQSGDTIGQPETVMEAERPSHIVILKIPQVDSLLSLPPSSLSVPPSPPPSSG
ncbi:hypothetical protein K493DRAFT_298160 [Basidiobolus meristosporus CBS 931.73]|uniref:Uncharacterized protein n=1 Tax=Basidiobolus meristosporus CBS 931.73 TaxID=1314790 RepID=A0A1Y1YV92_9FUNG|nr:hypothetical protein K493DRAFT_298160 [Basidiobolus meristosporus CBS 931.73]|eukprot:ORY01963.1 hypothetical protein K493DRAFT_298160 [Basidiobolus meristosporus CBS 931.73]